MNKKLFILATAALLSVFAGCKKVEDPKDDSSTGGNGAAAPEITAIAPQSGPVGTAVVISGKNFSATDTKVLFGAAEAVISDATATTLSVVAPQNELGQVTVKVTVGSKSATTAFTYTEAAVAAPVVSDQSATEGKAGSTLIFSGENLGTETAAYVVKFNNLEAEITDVTADAITVKVPASDGTSSAVVKVIPVGSETALYLGEFTWKFSRTVALGAIAGEIFEANKSLAIPVTITADEDAEELTADDVTVTFIDVNDPSKTYVATEVIVEEAGFTPIIPNKLKGEFKVKVEVAEALPVESAASFVVYYLPRYRVDGYAGAYGAGAWNVEGSINAIAGGYKTNKPTSRLNQPEAVCWHNNKLWVTTRGGSGSSRTHAIAVIDPSLTGAEDKACTFAYKMTEDLYPYDIVLDSKGVAHVACKTGADQAVYMGTWNGTTWEKYTVTGLPAAEVSYDKGVEEVDLLIDDNDNIYLADRDQCRVLVFKNKQYVKSYSTRWNNENIQVSSIAWNPDKSKIFIGAKDDRIIVMLDLSDGKLTKIAGTGICSIEYTDGATIKTNNFTNGENGPLSATLGGITGMVCDANGYLFFNDIHSAAVRVIVPGKGGDYTKGVVRTILGQPGEKCMINMDGGNVNNGNGQYYYYYDGDINQAFFHERGKIEIDPNGNIYIAETKAQSVRRITPIAE